MAGRGPPEDPLLLTPDGTASGKRTDRKTRKSTVANIAPVWTGHADFCNPFEFATFMRDGGGPGVRHHAGGEIQGSRPDPVRPEYPLRSDVASRFGLSEEQTAALERQEAALMEAEA